MRHIRQSTARNILVVMIDSSDHIAGKTGLTLTITASKNGGAFASITPTVTERTVGGYQLALTSSHTDTLGDLVLHITATGADPQDVFMEVIAYDPQDAVRLGLTALPNAAAEAAGGLYTRGSGAGQINQPANGMVDANVVRNAGTAITAASGVQEVKVASIANDAITAAAIAADAIGSSELATTAVTEIQSGLALAADLATVAGYLDTEIAAIKAKTDLLSFDAGYLAVNVFKWLGAGVALFPAANQGGTEMPLVSSGLLLHADICSGTGTTTTAVLSGSASAVDDFYNGKFLYIAGGTGAGQFAIITDYVGSTRTATFAALPVAPDTDSLIAIFIAPADVKQINGTEVIGDGDGTPWGPA